jgi:dihydrofolate synthase / folylpolyglutamate synthase
MRALTALLGLPQHRFASLHVVGTNGKSSVARAIAALLEAHGVAAGAFVSPHLERWSEQILVRGAELDGAALASAVERAAAAAAAVERGLGEGEAVTQFELATAAAFHALATARVEAAAIEAGLGGRLDATNTIPSRVTVLTSVGLEHTRWLGESEEEIAAEKLAVLRDHSTLVLGRVSPAVAALAARIAAERGAELVVAPDDPGAGVELAMAGDFQRRNFALACAATEAFLGELEPARVAAVAAGLAVPGRLERVGADPPVFLDAAHNPPAAAALAESLPDLVAGRPLIACLAVRAEKNAPAMIQALAPTLDRAICADLPTPPPADGPESRLRVDISARRRGLGAAELARACGVAGVAAEVEPDLAAAVRRGRDLAVEVGGALLVTGSHRVLAPARAALGLCED